MMRMSIFLHLFAENLYLMYAGHGSSVSHASFCYFMEKKMEKIKKTGASCWFKKDFKRESVKDKLYRWRMNVKYIYQRAKYGYCDRDIWYIDYWFLEVMPGMLQHTRLKQKERSSCPAAPSTGISVHRL